MSDEREYYWITNPETGTTSRWLASSPEEAVILAGYRPARRPASEETPEAAHARGVTEERARCLAIVQAARLVALDDLDAVNAGRLRTLEIRIEEGS